MNLKYDNVYIAATTSPHSPKSLLCGSSVGIFDGKIINKDIQFNLDNISNIKTYMFLPETIFSRSSFSRSYPSLKKVNSAKKADIILYDKKSIGKLLTSRAVYHYYEIVGNDLNLYRSRDRAGSANVRLCSTIIGTIGNIADYKNKLVHLDDFMMVDGGNSHTNLSIEEFGRLTEQVLSEDMNVVGAAIDTMLSYNSEYDIPKLLLIWAQRLNKPAINKSNKYVFHYKKFKRALSNFNYYNNKCGVKSVMSITNYINSVWPDHSTLSKECILNFFNCELVRKKVLGLDYKSDYFDVKIEFTYKSNNKETSKDQSPNIDEFIL